MSGVCMVEFIPGKAGCFLQRNESMAGAHFPSRPARLLAFSKPSGSLGAGNEVVRSGISFLRVSGKRRARIALLTRRTAGKAKTQPIGRLSRRGPVAERRPAAPCAVVPTAASANPNRAAVRARRIFRR